MTDGVSIRREGRAGRVTLTRPGALNALDHEMCRAISAALIDWAQDPEVSVVLIDAEGERAFCAGGDVARVHREATGGRQAEVQAFWRDEYRMNAMIAEYPKAVVSFLHGYVMGGGVGLGCHASHRVVCESARIAMPECGIGLIPDVGGSLLLARVPGRLGEYLGLTGARMGPGDAIYAGFADLHVPQDGWTELKRALVETGQPAAVAAAAAPAPAATLPDLLNEAEALFAGETLVDVRAALQADDGAFAAEARAALDRGAPLSLGCTLALLHRLKAERAGIRRALELEYRFTHRALAEADFLEGVRALIVDKDKRPRWRHAADALTSEDVAHMFEPLDGVGLDFHDWEDTAS
ncbi:enoyl-CoA hydratase/isomerase family protein [Roseivivax isoporae]|uniref:3-hydroxyisobutyryl-CoA hydrolase n=1 Tax=Roseivivax isoporae LMG 25204 TaxID=1449351 RepID=X7FD24_9RHOB|nr:enoyl-CoA hydratase/isomerase family protein [Roseivivax isoporae]ETX30633.1 enoyl-CoA hydratase [Roseivivax isoporae LMG 25204]